MVNKETEESYAEHQDTSKQVGIALVTNNFDNTLDYAEIGLDAFVSDGILKEIPIVKTVVGVVKSGLKVKEIFFAKKILTFMKEFHSGKLPKDKFYKFQQEFTSDAKYRAKVMEQIMVFNDTFLQVEKSKVLANLFAAHLNEFYGWDDFINLSLCLNQMNMFGVSLFNDMAKFKKPFFGAIYDDTKQLYHLLSSSGTISVWGNHLDITPYGLYIYHYGIQGKINEDVRKAYPLMFELEE
ncbi:hypothetical protein ACFPAF_01735 [Hymenobacter endophyticus]|uniref:Uncharacterized protein n=1 Tax=Hymenobacter endophyticus TaxID=3076335 RepID=A0ABU3TCK2_9BACT|nr:hypothetical protein [Hymenobacter endophyticus]MDU0369099.1 hypothetical protein [Hymenobacter endophyticus]